MGTVIYPALAGILFFLIELQHPVGRECRAAESDNVAYCVGTPSFLLKEHQTDCISAGASDRLHHT